MKKKIIIALGICLTTAIGIGIWLEKMDKRPLEDWDLETE